MERRSLSAGRLPRARRPGPAPSERCGCASPTGPRPGARQHAAATSDVRAPASSVEVVRRRSGGGAVLVVPGRGAVGRRGRPGRRPAVGRRRRPGLHWLGEAWAAALARARRRRRRCTTARSCAAVVGRGVLRRPRPGEVTVDGRKVVGISQRRTRAAARFQCAALGRWDPAALARPARDRRRPSPSSSRRHRRGVPLDDLLAAFLRHLPVAAAARLAAPGAGIAGRAAPRPVPERLVGTPRGDRRAPALSVAVAVVGPRGGGKWLTTPMNRHTVARSGTGEGLPRRRLVTHGRAADPLRRDLSSTDWTTRAAWSCPPRSVRSSARRGWSAWPTAAWACGPSRASTPSPTDWPPRTPPARPSASVLRKFMAFAAEVTPDQQGRVDHPAGPAGPTPGSAARSSSTARLDRAEIWAKERLGVARRLRDRRGHGGRRRRRRRLRRPADLALTGTRR